MSRAADRAANAVEAGASELKASYSEDPRPLPSYALLTGIFSTVVGATLFIAKRSRGALPERVSPTDLALAGIATFRVTRTLAKDEVASFIRAPFTQLEGTSGLGEVEEKPRGGGLRRAVGELLECPFCLGQWIAAAFMSGFALAPAATRIIASIFTVKAISDALQIRFDTAKQEVTQR